MKFAGASRQILKASVVVGSASLLVSGAQTLKDLVLAERFGVSGELGAFMMAFLIPSLVMSIVSSSVNASFMPVYVHTENKKGKSAAQQLLSGSIGALFAFLVVICLLLAISSPLLSRALTFRFSPEKQLLTNKVFLLLLPMLLLGGTASIFSSVLNARKHFLVSALSAGAIPAMIAASVLAFSQELGIFAIASGVVAGAGLQFLVLRLALKGEKLTLRFRWQGQLAELKAMSNQFFPTLAGSMLMSGTALVDQWMAAAISPSSVASLNYGNRITSFVAGLGATALGTAVFPHLAAMVSEKAWAEIRKTIVLFALAVFTVSIALVILLTYWSEDLIRILFERGAFTSSDTRTVAEVHRFFALQIPFYVAGMIGARFMNALSMNKVLMKINVVSLVINALANYVFMKRYGVAGIALSTSLVYCVATTTIFIFAFKFISDQERAHGP